MNKWYEVTVTAQKVYTVLAENEESAYDATCEAFGDDFLEMQAEELLDEEEVDRSQRHSDGIIEAEV